MMWSIIEFSGYAMLSRCTTHSKLACLICVEDTKVFYLPNGKKKGWFYSHRRFLPYGHLLRKNRNDFLKGKQSLDDLSPDFLTGVNPPKTSMCGGNGHENKKSGYRKYHNSHKENIFWKFLY